MFSKYNLIFPVSYVIFWTITRNWIRTESILFGLGLLFFIFLFSMLADARSRIKKQNVFEQVWQACFINGFIAGFSLIAPYFVLKEMLVWFEGYYVIYFLLNLVFASLAGGIVGFISIVIIFMCYSLLGGGRK